MWIFYLAQYCILFSISGARADLRNNDKKYPYELAKDPETAALVRQAGWCELLRTLAKEEECMVVILG